MKSIEQDGGECRGKWCRTRRVTLLRISGDPPKTLCMDELNLTVCCRYVESLLENSPRPRDSWVICGSALGLIEEAVEFAAGRIEGALLLFRAVVDQWAAVGPNRITNKFLGRDLS